MEIIIKCDVCGKNLTINKLELPDGWRQWEEEGNILLVCSVECQVNLHRITKLLNTQNSNLPIWHVDCVPHGAFIRAKDIEEVKKIVLKFYDISCFDENHKEQYKIYATTWNNDGLLLLI